MQVDAKDTGSIPGLGDPLEEGTATHSRTGQSHGQRSLAGYSLYGCTEQLSQDKSTKSEH